MPQRHLDMYNASMRHGMSARSCLGQLLGPNPGQPGHEDVERNERGQIVNVLSPYADLGLPMQRIQDFRRHFGWRDHFARLKQALVALFHRSGCN
jgi:hypothetical protein